MNKAWWARRSFWIQMLAGGSTLVGMFLGSTTLSGIVAYAVAMVFWFWAIFRDRLWGFMPLQVGATFVLIANYVRLT